MPIPVSLSPFACLFNLHLLILFCMLQQTSSAQENIHDTLYVLLEQEKDGIKKIDILIDLSNAHFNNNDFPASNKTADQALFLSQEKGYKPGLAKAYSILAKIYRSQGSYTEAKQFCFSAMEVAKEINDFTTLADVNHTLSNTYRLLGDYEKAFEYGTESLNISRQSGDQWRIGAAHIQLGNIHSDIGNYAESLENFKLSLNISKELTDQKAQMISYINIGVVYKAMGFLQEAKDNNSQAMILALALNNEVILSNLYEQMGILNQLESNFTESLKYNKLSLSLRKKLGLQAEIANSYQNLGSLYVDMGNYTEAMENIISSVSIQELIGDQRGIAYGYTSVGMILYRQNKLEEALGYADKALKIFKEIDSKTGLAMTNEFIATIYKSRQENDKALLHYLAALKIYRDTGNKSGIASGCLNLGLYYAEMGNLEAGKDHYHEALVHALDLHDDLLANYCYLNLGGLYNSLNQPETAKVYLQKALTLSKELDNHQLLKSTYSLLATSDSLEGNFESAWNNYRMYSMYKDSSFLEINNQEITEIREKYESEKKDKEIQKLESEKAINSLELNMRKEALHRIKLEKEKILTENLFHRSQVDLLANEKRLQQLEIEKNGIELAMQKAETDQSQAQVALLHKDGVIQQMEIKKQKLLKNYLLGGLALFTLLSFFIYNNYITRQKLKLQLLRNKIASDLHDDVGSTLSSIAIFSDIARQQSKEVIPMLDTIGENSRSMLDAMADIVWTIHPENDQFEKIILRMRNFAYQLLGAKKIDFVFTVDDSMTQLKLPMEVRKNLYLIFKEATNNMVKYSHAEKAHISIKEDKKKLVMTVQDNGKGFDVHQLTEGNGLKNMKKRAEEIGGQLWIESRKDEGTTIRLKVAV